MSFLPKTRFGVIWRALLAGVLIVGCMAGAVATAGLLTVGHLAQELGLHSRNIKGLTLPAPGKPETLLLIGSDHRSGSVDYTGSNTDTMLLIRIDDASSTINVMSVPRDLDVLGPGGVPVKLNSIYSTEGGPAGLLKVMKAQLFPHMQVNHVIDTNFTGFSSLIDAIGCVYSDVDHRYYNLTAPFPSPYNYSSIDIQPGYQKLCGGVHSPTGTNSALAFVRFRHTDSDVVRNARQQDFLRWAKEGYSSTQLLENEGRLVHIFSSYTQPDKGLATSKALLELFNLVANANSHSLRTVQFPEYLGPSFVYACAQLATCSGGGDGNTTIGQPTAATEAAWQEFITPTMAKHHAAVQPTANPDKPKKVHLGGINLHGLAADPGDGLSQSGELVGRHVGFPVYYPKDIVPSGAGLSQTYCFSITDDCNHGYEPTAAFTHSYPRAYAITGPGHVHYRSYVMTLEINSVLGEYYTVQGTTWRTPPILNHPSKVIHVHGRALYEYDAGAKIALVAFKTSRAVYWVSNTLNNAIANPAMIAMGAELTRYSPKA